MPSKYIRMIGFCILGGGAALALGSMNNLYRMSERLARYQEILAPHLAAVPVGGVYSGGSEELNEKFAIRIPTDDAIQLKFLQMASRSGADASTTRAFAIGGVIMMGIGMGIASNSTCSSRKNEEAEQAADGNPH
jgi:hypothetical protein